MCGISGIILNNKKLENPQLEKLNELMTHRGPDENGYFLKDNVGVAMRRLSILGLQNGSQPFFNRDETIVAVGNGEIYNFQEIKKQLAADNIPFRSTSDMEILPHLYEKYGIDFLEMLDGMFGIAIFDTKKNKTYIARDYYGVKPVFYGRNENGFYFSSDQRALIKSDYISAEFNTDQISNYLNLRLGPLDSEFFFKGIHILKAGSYIEIDNATQDFTERAWFSNRVNKRQSIDPKGFLEQTHSLLQKSINKRLISEVPIGTFLSSGIDSTLITAMAAKASNNNITSFTVGYDMDEGDESPLAKATADELGIPHHTLRIQPESFLSELNNCIEFNEAPLTHPNSVAVRMLTRFAKDKGFKVILSGEGADEVFGGYKRFEILQAMIQIKKKYGIAIPNLFGKLGYKFGEQELGILNNLKNNATSVSKLLLNYYKVSNTETNGILSRFKPNFKQFSSHADNINFNELLDDMLIMEQNTYMHELLLRQDKMSMYSSVEVRVPFIDKNLIRYVNQVEYKSKINNTQNKYYLRKIGEEYLSNDKLYRPKRGFSSPIEFWMKNHTEFVALVNTCHEQSIFNDSEIDIIRKTANKFLNGTFSDYEFIWKLINLKIFSEKYNLN